MSSALHTVRFERNVVTGLWRARCSCRWSRIGSRDHVQALAATHDLDPPDVTDPTKQEVQAA